MVEKCWPCHMLFQDGGNPTVNGIWRRLAIYKGIPQIVCLWMTGKLREKMRGFVRNLLVFYATLNWLARHVDLVGLWHDPLQVIWYIDPTFGCIRYAFKEKLGRLVPRFNGLCSFFLMSRRFCAGR